MRSLILTLLLAVACVATFGQSNEVIPRDTTTGEIAYIQVVDVDISKDVLFSNAKTWMAMNLKSAKKAIEMEDMATGRLIAKITNIEGGAALTTTEEFTITIDCREKRFRYKISDITLTADIVLSGRKDRKVITMTDYKVWYETNYSDATVRRAIELDNRYKAIGASIVKAMMLNDDF